MVSFHSVFHRKICSYEARRYYLYGILRPKREKAQTKQLLEYHDTAGCTIIRRCIIASKWQNMVWPSLKCMHKQKRVTLRYWTDLFSGIKQCQMP
jgi:hypothetical protein